jgi:hypothetical protein
MSQVGRVNSERLLRAELVEQRRRIARAEQEDIVIANGRRLLIQSPNGTMWSIGFTDEGILTTDEVEQ